MEHPIKVGLACAAYVIGACAWVLVMGGIRRPRRGGVAYFLGDMITTIVWPLSFVAWGVSLLEERNRD